MTCPICAEKNTRVLETRCFRGTDVDRRHQCKECGTTWKSVEKFTLGSLSKDGVRVADQKMPREVPPGVRFKVLKRDGFVCRYCGAKPPDVALEVDHVIPVSRGGSSELANLITSCRTCNGGKGASL